MRMQAITTGKAPLPVGPYSQAVSAGGFTFISGVLPIDPATGRLNAPDIATAAAVIFNTIDAILAAAGLSRSSVVKTTIFMINLQHFAEVNRIYGEYFSACGILPARSTIQVAGLPLGAPLEIELIAAELPG